jgi:hypothetical protein
MKRISILIITATLLIGCQNNTNNANYTNVAFSKAVKPISKSEICIDSTFNPHFIYVNADTLISCNIENEIHFQLHKLNNYKLLREFGIQGNGPTDLNDPLFWDQVFNTAKGTEILVYQMNSMKLSRINISRPSQGKNVELIQNIELPAAVGSNINIIKLGNNVFGIGIEALGNFFIFNIDDNTLKWKKFSIEFDENLYPQQQQNYIESMLNYGTIKAKPDNSGFVKSYLFEPLLEIYDKKGNLLKKIICSKINNPVYDNNTEQFEPSTKVYYANVYAGNKYIYALNLNSTLEEFGNNKTKHCFIDVYDFSGKAIKRLSIDEGVNQSATFTVDEKNKRIYTLSQNHEFNNLIIYNYEDAL